MKSIARGGLRTKQTEPAKRGPETKEEIGAPLSLQGTAKSKHPEFEKVTIYVRRETRKRAWRKWEDANGGDFSDLVEKLLAEYSR